jgi:hypothetical protein
MNLTTANIPQFEKTPYKQLMEGKIILIYAEVCGVAMLLSLLSFVPLFFAHGKYLLPTVHFAWYARLCSTCHDNPNPNHTHL